MSFLKLLNFDTNLPNMEFDYSKLEKKIIFYATMEDVFSDIDKVIIDKNGGDSVVPYLPFPELKKTQD